MSISHCFYWCPEPESNRHGRLSPRDFKSLVSTYFTIRAKDLRGRASFGVPDLAALAARKRRKDPRKRQDFSMRGFERRSPQYMGCYGRGMPGRAGQDMSS